MPARGLPVGEEDLGATMQLPFPHQDTDQKEATIIINGDCEALSPSPAYVKGLFPWSPFTIW